MSGWQAWVDYYTASIKQVYDISSMSTSNPCKAVNLAILGEDGKFWASSADFRTEDFKEADIALMLDAINCSEQDTRPCGDENCFMKPPKGFALLNTAEEKGHHILLGKYQASANLMHTLHSIQTNIVTSIIKENVVYRISLGISGTYFL